MKNLVFKNDDSFASFHLLESGHLDIVVGTKKTFIQPGQIITLRD